MTQYLPANLLALFQARDSIPYLQPTDRLPEEKSFWPYSGVAEYVQYFETKQVPPGFSSFLETRDERMERKVRERDDRCTKHISRKLEKWDPHNDPNVESDPYKTLFVGRLSYEVTESKLVREFEVYGPIKKVNLVHDRKGKPRGYAFIEFEHQHDMNTAYKHSDGKKIYQRRIVVDVERGRIMSDWRPRRLGGGIGGTRRGGPDSCSRYSGRDEDYSSDRVGYSHSSFDRRIDDSSGGRKKYRTDRSRSKEKDRDRERDREGKRKIDDGAATSGRKKTRSDRSRSRDRDKDKDKDKDKDRDRERKRDKDKDKDKDRDKPREKERNKDREKRKERDRDNGITVKMEATDNMEIKQEPM